MNKKWILIAIMTLLMLSCKGAEKIRSLEDVSRLSSLSEPGDIQKMFDAIEFANREVRSEAVWILGTERVITAAPIFATLAVTDGDFNVRVGALRGLRRLAVIPEEEVLALAKSEATEEGIGVTNISLKTNVIYKVYSKTNSLASIKEVIKINEESSLPYTNYISNEVVIVTNTNELDFIQTNYETNITYIKEGGEKNEGKVLEAYKIITNGEALAAVKQCLFDTVLQVRIEATKASSVFRDESLLPPLLNNLASKNRWLRMETVITLSYFDDKKVEDAFEKLRQNEKDLGVLETLNEVLSRIEVQ